MLEVTCDGCREYLSDDEYCIHRLDNEEQVAEVLELYEWTMEKDAHYCRTCTCERTTGHQLRSWPERSYRSCDCGQSYEPAVTVKVAGGVL